MPRTSQLIYGNVPGANDCRLAPPGFQTAKGATSADDVVVWGGSTTRAGQTCDTLGEATGAGTGARPAKECKTASTTLAGLSRLDESRRRAATYGPPDAVEGVVDVVFSLDDPIGWPEVAGHWGPLPFKPVSCC